MRILIVDDDPAIRVLLTAQLHQMGHEIDTASDGSEAWGSLRRIHFDLLICDWNMPVMDGLELCRQIRSSEWPSYVYVILCTAMKQKADFLAGMEAGADDFIVKPVDFADLRVRVRAAQRIVDLQSELQTKNKNLQGLYDELRTVYNTIERDLQAAAATQLELLPKKRPISNRVKLDWLLVPSLFLAGDMLNYFLVGGNKLVFYHLDVAGHGIPAALLSVMLNRILMPVAGTPIAAVKSDGSLGELLPPAAVVTELNRRFQATDDSYFTMVYGILDLESRDVIFCQAGHPAPVLLSQNGDLRCLGEGGFPVGMFVESDFGQISEKLDPGDRLILYSDGIPECVNPEGKRYSKQQFLDLLKGCAASPFDAFVQSVNSDISLWRRGAELSDDLSLLAFEVC